MKLGGSDDDLVPGSPPPSAYLSDNPASSISTDAGSARGAKRSSLAGFSRPSPSIPLTLRSN